MHQPAAADILILDEGNRLLHSVNALLRPEIGLLLNGTQAGITEIALCPCPFLAVAYQQGDDLVGQTQIVGKGQKDFQLLRIQGATQHTLNLPIQRLKAFVTVHSGKHIPFGVLGALPGDDIDLLLLRPKPQLPQSGGSAGDTGLGKLQGSFCLLGVAAVGYVQI